MPLRHIQEAERPDQSPPGQVARRIDDEAILDVTRKLVLNHGIARTTLTDVAREAGLSRMTVYRRWSDGLPQLLGAMMQREWDHLLALDPPTPRLHSSDPVRQILVREVVRAARTLRDSELLASMLVREPQLLMPYLVERQGTMHRRAVGVIAEGIRAGQADGSIAGGDPVRMATSVVLATQSWVVSLNAAGSGLSNDELDEELRRMLHGYLGPVALAASVDDGEWPA